MRLFLAIAFACFCIGTARADDLPPMPGGGMTRVNDYAHALTSDQVRMLKSKIAGLESSIADHPQIVVLTVDRLPNGQEIEEFATAVFRKWGIGDKTLNNGVLLVWSKGDRKTKIEPGYGIEPRIPDVTTKRILVEMRDDLRSERYYAALDGALTSIGAELSRTSEPVTVASPAEPDEVVARAVKFFLVLCGLGAAGCVVGLIVSHRANVRRAKILQELETRRMRDSYGRPVSRFDPDLRYNVPSRPYVAPTRSRGSRTSRRSSGSGYSSDAAIAAGIAAGIASSWGDGGGGGGGGDSGGGSGGGGSVSDGGGGDSGGGGSSDSY